MRRYAILLILIAVCLGILSCKQEEASNNTATTETASTASTVGSTSSTTGSTSAASSSSMKPDLPDVPHKPLRPDCAKLKPTNFEVDIVFTGLMMFVPDDLDTTQPLVEKPTGHAQTTWTVLIPNARVAAGPKLPPDDPQDFMPHTPFVGADPQYLCADSSATLLNTWCSMFTYSELKGQDINWDMAFTGGVTSPPQYSVTVDGGGICPTKTDGGSLHWLPSMGEIGFAGHLLDPALVGAHPSADAISGRAALEGGTLEACVLSTQKMNFRIRHVGDAEGPVTRAMAEEVHYKLTGSGRTFVLKLAPRGGGQAETLELAPVDGKVELRIGNVPKTFIPPTIVLGAPEKMDPHFGIYHQFVRGAAATPIIPHEKNPPCASAPCRLSVSRPCVRPAGGNPSPEGANCPGVKP